MEDDAGQDTGNIAEQEEAFTGNFPPIEFFKFILPEPIEHR